METRYNIEDWLDGALEALARKGPQAITIQQLCEFLGVSRGSFYWHFKNRDTFIEKLMDFWIDKTTNAIADAVRNLDGPAVDKLLFIARQVIESDATRYDIPVRAWAETNSIAAAAVKRADRIRYKVVRELFAETRFSGEELEMRTRTFVAYYSLERAISVNESKKARLSRIEMRHRLLTRPT
ncbi:MAG: TetR/AcrR family transcriptional regulator [Gammaproteobacteria bacterium]|nr:TetR/AcrR family transcriptional regulator [Gammaproteobacteria bacterium]